MATLVETTPVKLTDSEMTTLIALLAEKILAVENEKFAERDDLREREEMGMTVDPSMFQTLFNQQFALNELQTKLMNTMDFGG